MNYFCCTEYHPGVLEDGMGVTWLSDFLPEKKCTYTEGSGLPTSPSLDGGRRDAWLRVCQDMASMGISVWSLKLLEEFSGDSKAEFLK